MGSANYPGGLLSKTPLCCANARLVIASPSLTFLVRADNLQGGAALYVGRYEPGTVRPGRVVAAACPAAVPTMDDKTVLNLPSVRINTPLHLRRFLPTSQRLVTLENGGI